MSTAETATNTLLSEIKTFCRNNKIQWTNAPTCSRPPTAHGVTVKTRLELYSVSGHYSIERVFAGFLRRQGFTEQKTALGLTLRKDVPGDHFTMSVSILFERDEDSPTETTAHLLVNAPD